MIDTGALMPWLQAPLQALQAAAQAGRLPQGLLLHEAPGAGGLQLVKAFARLVLCQSAQRNCGQCSACQRVDSGEHPDLLRVVPPEDSKLQQIGVDEVRDACAQLVLSSYEGRGSVAVILPADAMTHQAANSLLKTLEEPRAGLHIVLLTSRPSALPATIHSRCQRLALPAPSREQASQWLQAQRPSPDWPAALDACAGNVQQALDSDPQALRLLRDDTARALAEALAGRLDVLRTAEAWSRDELPLRLNCIENWLTQRILRDPAIARETAEIRTGTHLPEGASALNIARTFGLLDTVREVRATLGTSLNKALAMERLLWGLVAAGSSANPRA